MTKAGRLPARRTRRTLYRVDENHSNAYNLRPALGSPQEPTPEQVAELKAAGQLQEAAPPELNAADGAATLRLTLPRKGVALVVVE